MINRILVPTDGSPHSLLAAEYAAYLATKLNCPVTLLHVVEKAAIGFYLSYPSDNDRRELDVQIAEAGRSIVRLTQKPLAEAGIAADYELKEGRPADVICKVAQEGEYDLIVMGHRGRGLISRVISGSVAQEVIRAAPCSVLTVRNR